MSKGSWISKGNLKNVHNGFAKKLRDLSWSWRLEPISCTDEDAEYQQQNKSRNELLRKCEKDFVNQINILAKEGIPSNQELGLHIKKFIDDKERELTDLYDQEIANLRTLQGLPEQQQISTRIATLDEEKSKLKEKLKEIDFALVQSFMKYRDFGEHAGDSIEERIERPWLRGSKFALIESVGTGKHRISLGRGKLNILHLFSHKRNDLDINLGGDGLHINVPQRKLTDSEVNLIVQQVKKNTGEGKIYDPNKAIGINFKEYKSKYGQQNRVAILRGLANSGLFEKIDLGNDPTDMGISGFKELKEGISRFKTGNVADVCQDRSTAELKANMR